jgi:integrase
MQNHRLTDEIINIAINGQRPKKISDGHGLTLFLHQNGSNYWRHRYCIGGREKTLSYGQYPEISIEAARLLHEKSVEILKRGIDPGLKPPKPAVLELFKDSWTSWFYGPDAKINNPSTWSGYAKKLSQTHIIKVVSRFERLILPKWGRKRIVDITAADALSILVTIQKDSAQKGYTSDVAHRVKHHMRLLWNDAILRFPETGVTTNIVEIASTSSSLNAVVRKNRAAAVEAFEFRDILNKIDSYQGQGGLVQLALKLLYLTISRPGMVRGARWSEFHVEETDLFNRLDEKNEITRNRYDKVVEFDYGSGPIRMITTPALWIVPAHRMKVKTIDIDGKPRDHIIPLSSQVCEVLIKLYEISGNSEYLFPGYRANRTISDNTLNAALRTLGIDGTQHVSHGFRASATSILSEQPLGYDKKILEAQLSHIQRDKHGGAYHRAKFLHERAEMLQTWADYCEQIKKGTYGYIDRDKVRKASNAPAKLARLLTDRKK